MNDKQQLAAMGEHMQEEIAWRNKDSPNGIRRFMTGRQYQNQSDAIKQYYEPYRCANCMDSEFKVPDGWRLVPAKMTDAMENAIYKELSTGSLYGFKGAYSAMLAAAPEYKP